MIVVGAGWAGLTVANALRNAGVEHVVLEGRSRIGGRAHTVDVAGVPMDLGCSWIHEPMGNPMTRFAEQAGVGATTPTSSWTSRSSAPTTRSPTVRSPCREGRRVRARRELRRQRGVGHLRRARAAGASVRDGAQVYLDRQGLEGDARRYAEFVIQLIAESGDNYEWERISLDYWANYESPYTRRRPG